MNNGLKIILARMDTNPEEFQSYPNSRWRELIDSHWDIFLDEERDEYQAKLRVILVDKFSELVVKELMDDEPETMRYKASERYAIGGIDPRGAFGNAPVRVKLNGTQISMANALGIPLNKYAEQLAKKGITDE
jgi:hypothetical protein